MGSMAASSGQESVRMGVRVSEEEQTQRTLERMGVFGVIITRDRVGEEMPWSSRRCSGSPRRAHLSLATALPPCPLLPFVYTLLV